MRGEVKKDGRVGEWRKKGKVIEGKKDKFRDDFRADE